MLFEIAHRTRYHYDQAVYLEPFTVRLRPRCDAAQSLRSYAIDVTPLPSGIAHCVGLDGNNTETIWFSGMHHDLVIDVHTQVETHHGDTFDFLVTDPAALNLPLKYDPHLAGLLARYLVRDSDDSGAAAYAREIMQAAKQETIPFLSLLAESIPKRHEYLMREDGDPWTPAETMNQGRGSCRDFAVLFIDLCRSVGIAARFVSGYCIVDAAAGSDMHAWAEVYLPGAGWRGFDPSRGLSISDDYIAVAAGQSPREAAPTSGSFRGEAVSSLVAEISITIPESASGHTQ